MKLQERLNLIKGESGMYCGYLQNLPMLLIQADSIEQSKEFMKSLLKTYAEELLKLAESAEPFTVKEFESRREWHNAANTPTP
jgi:hypothetical protein